ncbi:hypothetical protein sos41_21630 [Alphaproteobacteria bacterium SO-S41]|nr:hypothetical protein sos41_21630 [Alphaproteobacteria bacterium SO-S41]
MSKTGKDLGKPAASGDVAAFLEQLAKVPAPLTGGTAGRLIFALDATMSRQPTWDIASKLQAEMFDAAAGLKVQLVSFRGIGEFEVRPWTDKSAELKKAMAGYGCRGGFTQIERTLRHAAAEAGRTPVQAFVYVGDAAEEMADAVCDAAGRLGLAGTPAFMFQEGANRKAETLFKEVARLTKGAYARFDASSADALRDLLRAVAVFASGGRKALADHAKRAGGAALLLTRQMGS